MRKRTQARAIALQAIYQMDVQRKMTGVPAARPESFEELICEASEDPEVREYARLLVEGVGRHMRDLDDRITRVSDNWKLNRIAAVDRSILRIAIFEMLEVADVPPKVAINEAIDLAKTYSTEQSGSFVNGLLDRVYAELRGGAEESTGTPQKV